MELSIRFARGEEAETSRIFQHLSRQHVREPGVAVALQDWLMQIGAIRPDGTPAAAAVPSSQGQPSLVVPTETGADPGKLWTPGGQQALEEKPKLWMPGMD